MFSKGFLGGFIFGGAYLRRGLLLEGTSFAFQNRLDLTITTTNSILSCPWAYILEGLLWEGYLRLRFGGLFSGGLIIGILRYLNLSCETS